MWLAFAIKQRLDALMKKPGSVLILSLLISTLLVSALAYNFLKADEAKFSEKKRTVVLNFQETLSAYHSLLTAYGHLFTQLYYSGLLTSSNSFVSETSLEGRKEIRAIGYYILPNQTNSEILYLEQFGNESVQELSSVIQSLDLVALGELSRNENTGIIKKFNANYVIYIKPVTGVINSTIDGYVFILINQQDIFRMLSMHSPNYTEYRIYDISDRPTPVFTHTMDDRTYFPFTRTRASVDEVVTFASFPWLFRFYFYDSVTEITQFILILLLIIVGLFISLVLYSFSLRNYRALRKAMHLESQKDEFVAIASHELKTPLTSIKALNQILAQRMDAKGNALFESFFRKMDAQILRMENLINDLLDVSRIRSGKLNYNMAEFDLENVIRTAVDEVSTIRKSHRITVNGSLSKKMYGDKDRISQVVTNVLINSIKYSPQANLIIVNMEQVGDEAIVAVQDFGIGISRENQKRIFERFYRVSTDEQKYKGLGIGLFISSEIIRKHRGKIWVKSKKNKGSTFYFSLPFSPRAVQ